MRRRTLLLTFLAAALAGLAAWALSNPRVDRILFGVGNPPSYYDYLFGPFSFGLPLAVLVAAAAGYASPRRFWLWGFAVVLPRPVMSMFMYVRGASTGVIGPSDYAGLAFVEVAFFMNFVLICTVASAGGAGLRVLARRISSRRTPEEEAP